MCRMGWRNDQCSAGEIGSVQKGSETRDEDMRSCCGREVGNGKQLDNRARDTYFALFSVN